MLPTVGTCGLLAASPTLRIAGTTRLLEQLPPIISKVKTLEVVNAKLKGAGTHDAIVEIEIKNNSPKPIIAVAIESGDKKDASGTTLNGFNEGDVPPNIVVKPFEVFQMYFSLANVRQGHPIRIGGVVYADGMEEGDEITLGTIRRQRDHYKKIMKGGSEE